MNLVLNRAVVVDSDWPFDSLLQSLWLWRWLPHRLSKRQSLSTTTVLFRTTFTRTINLNLLLKWLLGSNLSQWCFTSHESQTSESAVRRRGPTVFRPYPRRTVCRCHYKAALKDPECCSCQGLNTRPPAQQTGALPTELTRRCLMLPSNRQGRYEYMKL